MLTFTRTGKSLSEALLFAEHGEYMLCTKNVLNVGNNFCTQHVLPRFELGIFMYWTCNSMNNLSSYCGLVDAKIRASDKDLPVWPSWLCNARSIKIELHERPCNILESHHSISGEKGKRNRTRASSSVLLGLAQWGQKLC